MVAEMYLENRCWQVRVGMPVVVQQQVPMVVTVQVPTVANCAEVCPLEIQQQVPMFLT